MKPTLFATASTARAVARGRAAAILVGGYDGSGNYGDIAQLEAALELVGRLGPNLVVLAVLEREFLKDYRMLNPRGEEPTSGALFFDPDGAGFEDDLVPVAAPAELAFGACYLYGGGYLNRSWGDRKLAMLRSAEGLLEAGGAANICRLSSGLQVDAGWIEKLDETSASTLRSFDFLGVRDPDSGTALEALGPAVQATRTADDAVGVLRQLPAAKGPPAANGGLHVNLHFAEHDWVSERPRALLDFYAEFVAELGRLAERQVIAQPLIAYLDERIDERPGVERLSVACAALGVKVATPVVLRPATLEQTAPGLRQASLTLSCSYHVALTSLMLEVPAVLLSNNPYYAQKAAGLREDFELPAPFTTTASADPVLGAREIATTVLDGEHRAAQRRRLATQASHVIRRRCSAETELLAHMGSAAMTALSNRIEVLAERLRERSAEPVELLAQVAKLQSEQEELRRLGEVGSPLEAELRAQEAEGRSAEAHEQLATILHSRSWRILAPLRWLGALLRRR